MHKNFELLAWRRGGSACRHAGNDIRFKDVTEAKHQEILSKLDQLGSKDKNAAINNNKKRRLQRRLKLRT